MLSTELVDPWVVCYNLGNGYYRKNHFKDAEKYYEKALKYDVPEAKECNIRINLAMTKTKMIDFDSLGSRFKAYFDGEDIDIILLISDIQNAISDLKSARKVLTESGCAGEKDNSGHSPTAEVLKADIDDTVKKLEEMLSQLAQGNSSQNGDNGSDSDIGSNDGKPSSGVDSDERENEIRKKIEEQQKNALGEQNERQRVFEQYYDIKQGEGGSSQSGFNGKSW
jgi:tetratricopeptide (TPR) repeat protein